MCVCVSRNVQFNLSKNAKQNKRVVYISLNVRIIIHKICNFNLCYRVLCIISFISSASTDIKSILIIVSLFILAAILFENASKEAALRIIGMLCLSSHIPPKNV